MKSIFKILIFILIFIIFKEVTYYIFEVIDIKKNPNFLGEPKDLIYVRIAIFGLSVCLVFMFYFLDELYKFFKNQIFNKIIVFIIIVFIQIITLYAVFNAKIPEEAYTSSKTYLSILGISLLIIIISVLALSELIKSLISNKK